MIMGRDPHPASHRHLPQGAGRRAQFEARADRLLGIVLVRLGVAE
jgi:hypothetical protein